MAFCKVSLIGNVGGDPEVRYTPNGQSVTTFSVAVNQSTKNKQTGEWDEATDWFRVTMWGQTGERVAETIRKGNKVFLDGRFKSREYEAKDGTKKTSFDVTADTCIAVDAKEAQAEQAEGNFAMPAAAASTPGHQQPIRETFDDLPF